MVRAILAGNKTQTRRVVKPQPEQWTTPDGCGTSAIWPAVNHNGRVAAMRCPYGQPGDRLWVRESTAEDCIGSASFARYTADGFTSRIAWWYSRKACPSIHMPRWASRILLEITAVRVERLQDISEADALAEGVIEGAGDFAGCFSVPGTQAMSGTTAKECYARLWYDINGAGSWAANPWVWVIEFKVVCP